MVTVSATAARSNACEAVEGRRRAEMWGRATGCLAMRRVQRLLRLADEVVALADQLADEVPDSPLAEFLSEDMGHFLRDLDHMAYAVHNGRSFLDCVIPVVKTKDRGGR